jgi:hypothetical protein
LPVSSLLHKARENTILYHTFYLSFNVVFNAHVVYLRKPMVCDFLHDEYERYLTVSVGNRFKFTFFQIL